MFEIKIAYKRVSISRRFLSIILLINLALVSGCAYDQAMIRESERSVFLNKELQRVNSEQVRLNKNKVWLQQHRSKLMAEISALKQELANSEKQVAKLQTTISKLQRKITKLEKEKRSVASTKAAMLKSQKEEQALDAKVRQLYKTIEEKKRKLEKM